MSNIDFGRLPTPQEDGMYQTRATTFRENSKGIPTSVYKDNGTVCSVQTLYLRGKDQLDLKPEVALSWFMTFEGDEESVELWGALCEVLDLPQYAQDRSIEAALQVIAAVMKWGFDQAVTWLDAFVEAKREQGSDPPSKNRPPLYGSFSAS